MKKSRKWIVAAFVIAVVIVIVFIVFYKLNISGNVISELNSGGKVRLITECEIYSSLSDIKAYGNSYSVSIGAPVGSFGEVSESARISLGEKYWYGNWRGPKGASLGLGWVNEDCFVVK